MSDDPFDVKLGSREYNKINEAHVKDPKPGDYWHEMLCPCLIVLDRYADDMIIVCTKRLVFSDGWLWDLDKPEFMSLEALRKKVTYGSHDGFCADVFPEGHKRFADQFKTRIRT